MVAETHRARGLALITYAWGGVLEWTITSIKFDQVGSRGSVGMLTGSKGHGNPLHLPPFRLKFARVENWVLPHHTCSPSPLPISLPARPDSMFITLSMVLMGQAKGDNIFVCLYDVC